MSIKQLIWRSLKKNIKNYYLYVFALIFSVALYFSFVTLQYDPAMDETKGSIKGAAAIATASILLVVIVAIFLLYANSIFIRRRSKEIGLFQLIGLTKSKIFGLLSTENFIIYFSSLGVGILAGFSVSRLIMMILFKIMGIEEVATLHFSIQALSQTLVVFSFIFLFIMSMNYLFIKRQSILSLFRVMSSTEDKVKKLSLLQIGMGIIGMIFILVGYFVSSILFAGYFTTMNELFMAMSFILASVISGTYFFYKGSVSFIFHLIRKKKAGYLNIKEVLSLSSIMFRMKSNALLLTIITTVSALSIGFIALSYISYYSADKMAESNIPANFSLTNLEDAELFKLALETNNIEYTEKRIDVLQVHANLEQIMETNLDELTFEPEQMILPVISDSTIPELDLTADELLFSGENDFVLKFMSLKDSGELELKGQTEVIPLQYVGLKKKTIIPYYFTGGGLPTAIVDETVFHRLQHDLEPEIQHASPVYIGIDIVDRANIRSANELFHEVNFSSHSPQFSRLDMSTHQKMNMGLMMFIVGFLGLAFLITSGCILYFKQMDESEEEKSNYTILRKLGFTQQDLLTGVKAKQLFSFGIPLVLGLAHSYFAVKSGWFFFGTELWSPMLIVMVIYTALYSIFGLLSVHYYKQVIKEAL